MKEGGSTNLYQNKRLKPIPVQWHVSTQAANENLASTARILFTIFSITQLFKFLSERDVVWICHLDDALNLIQTGRHKIWLAGDLTVLVCISHHCTKGSNGGKRYITVYYSVLFYTFRCFCFIIDFFQWESITLFSKPERSLAWKYGGSR